MGEWQQRFSRGFYGLFGGRKLFSGYLFAGLVVWLGLRLGADFVAIAGFLAGGLGITSGSIAYEDTRRDEDGHDEVKPRGH